MINAVSQSTGSTAATTAASQSNSNDEIGLNGFLTMFTTQLQYQDPSNPLQSYQLASQLAQFTSVEQLTQMNTNLQTMQTSLNSIYNTQMVDMLGKQITGSSNTLQVSQGQASQGSYQLSEPADVTIKISDAQGNTVRTITVGNEAAGTHDVKWDGLTDSGTAADDGLYHFTVEATDADGNAVNTTSTVTGKCCSVRNENGTTVLVLNNANGPVLPASSVLSVGDASASS